MYLRKQANGQRQRARALKAQGSTANLRFLEKVYRFLSFKVFKGILRFLPRYAL